MKMAFEQHNAQITIKFLSQIPQKAIEVVMVISFDCLDESRKMCHGAAIKVLCGLTQTFILVIVTILPMDFCQMKMWKNK